MSECIREKHTVHRVISLLLVAVMLVGLLAMPALAGNSVTKNSKNFRGNRAEFYLTTGKGLFYSWGWWKTKVTVTNPDKYQPLYVYQKLGNACIWLGTVNPKCSRAFEFKGSNKNYTIFTQRANNGGRYTVQAYAHAGSIR